MSSYNRNITCQCGDYKNTNLLLQLQIEQNSKSASQHNEVVVQLGVHASSVLSSTKILVQDFLV